MKPTEKSTGLQQDMSVTNKKTAATNSDGNDKENIPVAEEKNTDNAEFTLHDEVIASFGKKTKVRGTVVRHRTKDVYKLIQGIGNEKCVQYFVQSGDGRRKWVRATEMCLYLPSESRRPLRTLTQNQLKKSAEIKRAKMKRSEELFKKRKETKGQEEEKPKEKREPKLVGVLPMCVTQRKKTVKNVEYQNTIPDNEKRTNPFIEYMVRWRDHFEKKIAKDQEMGTADEGEFSPPTQTNIDHYLKDAWYFHDSIQTELSQMDNESDESDDEKRFKKTFSTTKLRPPVKCHISWCLVCGAREGRLLDCDFCPAKFHQECDGWKDLLNYRMTFTTDKLEPSMLANLRSNAGPSKKESFVCPSCYYGPPLVYGDLVWFKLRPWNFWPARILFPGELTKLTSKAEPQEGEHLPIMFYGDVRNYAWARRDEMVPLLLSHRHHNIPEVSEHYESACTEYIRIYLANQLRL